MSNTLWFETPAKNWEECLPVGNGSLGGMIYGGVYQDKLQVNEESVWYGKKLNRNNPDAKKYLPKIRELILKGEFQEAQNYATYAFSGVPSSQRTYQTLGDLLFCHHYKSNNETCYKRWLDVDNSIVGVSYDIDDISYTRTVFASNPDDVIIVKFSASKPNSINFDMLLTRSDYLPNPAKSKSSQFTLYGTSKYYSEIKTRNNNQLTLIGDGGKDAIEFCMSAKVKSIDGEVNVIGETVVVRNATEVTIYFAADTSYKSENFLETCITKIDKAEHKQYSDLYNAHLADYKNLYSRMNINFMSNNGFDYDSISTDKRRKDFDSDKDINFVSLYFQFCRYLMISSSRGCLPTNLQGIWCNHFDSPWDSKFTININAQMNYWAVDIANLSECGKPLYSFLKELEKNGKITAQEMYGMKGALAHHNTDIWADTAPQDIVTGSTYWVFGLAWMALHLYEHYQFSKDINFIKEHYYIIKSACEFCLDWLYEYDGELMTIPSTSPENVYISNGKNLCFTKSCASDFEIMSELFDACIKSSEVLDCDNEFRDALKEKMRQFPEYKIGSKGQLLEWGVEYGEIDPGHRHFSHLISLYPGKQFDLEINEKLNKAAKKSLELRLEYGSAQVGWSCAWAMNFFARLRQGKDAYKYFTKLIANSTIDNLLNSHPPYQIDGNFGALAGICEMFIQSHNEKILLLPSVDKNIFKNGKIEGLKARGNIVVDIYIVDGKLDSAKFKSPISQKVTVEYQDITQEIKLTENRITEIIF